MLHVEAVIKMLDPTFNLRRIAVKRLSLSQTLSCLAVDRESDDDRVQ